MLILNLLPSLSSGGAERQLSYLAPELIRRGHQVHIGYLSEGPQKPALPGVILHKLSVISNYDPSLLIQLITLIKRIKPDIVQTWILQMDILGGIAAKITKVPWVLRESNQSLAYPSNWKHCLRFLLGCRADTIVSNSIGGGDYWKDKTPEDRRYIIPNVLPNDEIEKCRYPLPALFTDGNLPIVLFVARLEIYKRPLAFLQALAYVKQKMEVMGLIGGNGPLLHEVKLVQRKLNLNENVFVIGHLPIQLVWSLMKKASVLVSLSEFEGCPNTVMEAMLCGCPLVLSDIPSHREILDESCALFVDPLNTQEIGDAVIEVLNNTEETKKRILNARRKTLEWSIPEMARKYEIVYQNAMRDSLTKSTSPISL